MLRFYKGETLKVMDKLIKEGIKFDAIITDPPYGTTACKWDIIIPFSEMWNKLKLLRKKRTPIVLFGGEPFSSALRISNIKEYKYDWVWNKTVGGNPINNKIMPAKTTEQILVFGKGGINYYPIMENAKKENIRPISSSQQKSDLMGNFKNGFKQISDVKKRYPKHLIEFNSRKAECNPLNRLPSTQKPIELLEYLIKTYTNEGDLILDFTAGSGSTLIACQNLNRSCIGIDNGYCEKKNSIFYKWSWKDVTKNKN